MTTEGRNILGLAIASQASLSIVQWGIGALGPDLESHYGMNAAALGALLQAAAVGNALALVLAGGLVDQQGVRVPMIVGGIGAGATLALGAFAPSAWVLGGALVVFGVFGSLIAVAGSVAVFHAFGRPVAAWRWACARCPSRWADCSPPCSCPGSPTSAGSAWRSPSAGSSRRSARWPSGSPAPAVWPTAPSGRRSSP